MSTAYRRSPRLARLGLLAQLALPACDTRDVDVGTLAVGASASLDLTRCRGARTRCARSDHEVPVLAIADELIECSPDGERPALRLAWTERTGLSNVQIAQAPDGALWAAGSGADPERTLVVVERYTADGVLLSRTETSVLEGHDAANATVRSLALDTRGHGFIAVTTSVADQASGWVELHGNLILELDAHGETVGAPIDVPGVRSLQLAVGEDDALVMTAEREGRLAAIGRLEPDRTLAWVQDGTGHPRLVDIAGDAEGRVFMLGPSSRVSDVTSAAAQLFAVLDADGNWQWGIEPLFDLGSFVLSDDGGAFVAGSLAAAPDGDSSVQLTRLSASGTALWSKRIAAGQGTSPLALDAEGSLYFSARRSASGSDVVFRVGADGGACTAMSAPLDVAAYALHVGRDGSLFVANFGQGTGWSIGRLAP